MGKALLSLILALGVGLTTARAEENNLKIIPVDSTNISQVRAIPNAFELNVCDGDTNNHFYNFNLSSNKNGRQGGIAATIDGLASKIKDKILGKEPSPFVLVYRHQRNVPDSLPTQDFNYLMQRLGADSVFLYTPSRSDEYVF
jgi:hypothetical protein